MERKALGYANKGSGLLIAMYMIEDRGSGVSSIGKGSMDFIELCLTN
ncbi:MAG: hypothetical protein ABF649_17985 [Bacillus sp. (in: firmicutes)]